MGSLPAELLGKPLLFTDILIIANLAVVRCYLIVVLNCTSLIIRNFVHFFLVIVGPLYIFFEKMSVQIFCSFFNWVLCFYDIELYDIFILDFNPLAYQLQVYSPVQQVVFFILLFYLLVVSFAVQNFLTLIRSRLFSFAFISFALRDRSKKYCCNLCQRMFCLCSLLGVLWLQVLHLGLNAF